MNNIKKGVLLFFAASLLLAGCSHMTQKQVNQATTEITETAGQDVEKDLNDLAEETKKSIQQDSEINEKNLSSTDSLKALEEDES